MERPGERWYGRGREGAEGVVAGVDAAGIDVGASSHFVAVSEASAEECVREFEAYTSELYRMANWLRVRGGDGGDGVDGSVLDTFVRGAGGAGT